MLPLVLYLLVSLADHSLAKPGGAPPTACQDMIPRHGVPPQISPFPYIVIVSHPYIARDSALTITIRGGARPTFKGFMVQARTAAKNVLGAFSTGWDAQTISCPGGTNTTATHVNNNPKSQVVLGWAPPRGFTGTVDFYVTIVEEKLKFWAARKVGSVNVIQYTTQNHRSQVNNKVND